jgi:dCMP deaminase
MRNKNEVFMRIAWELSALGTCDRKQVGAVFVRDGRCITWGYNGAPPGLQHCNYNDHGWKSIILDELNEEFPGFRDTRDPDDPQVEEMHELYMRRLDQKMFEGCRNATHAEANGLAFAARQGISTEGATLFVTCSPCDVCARLLIAAGIVAVYYDEEYRDPSGRELLERAGVQCQRISPS